MKKPPLHQRLLLTAGGMFAQVNDPLQRLQLESRALTLLIAGIRTTLITALIGPALIAWLTLPQLGPVLAFGPAGVLYLITIERFVFVRRAQRHLQHRDPMAPARGWLRAVTWRTGLSALVVASWGYPVVATNDTTLIFMILALATIVSASSMAQFCCWPPAMWASFTPILLGLGLQILLFGGDDRWFGAVFTFLLWATLVMAGLRFAHTLHNDMTTRLLNEKLMHELEEKRQQAEAANAAKSRFFAAASHDLRQPLQAMILYLSVLESDPSDVKTLSRLSECMAALNGLLEVVMDISRLESGSIVPKPCAFAVQPFLERIGGMYEESARQKGLQLRIHPTTTWACSDPVLLERALSNLMSNAIRYTDRGGILLAARKHGERLRLSVVDTGMGIPEPAFQSIFEEFVQLGNPERDPSRGSGLGLPTVQRVAALLGHPLSLRSRVGRGSNFGLEMPAVPAASDLPVPEQDLSFGPSLAGQVLVVEDNAAVRDSLVSLLTHWGLASHCAKTGEEAIEALGKAHFDAVLSDFRLPGELDGIAVLREARKKIPGLSLSVLITGEDLQLLPNGGKDFLVLRKPLRPLRLRSLLQAHLCPAADRPA